MTCQNGHTKATALTTDKTINKNDLLGTETHSSGHGTTQPSLQFHSRGYTSVLANAEYKLPQ